MHSGWDVMPELRRLGIHVPTTAYLPKPFLLEALLRLVFKTSGGAGRGSSEIGHT